MKFDELARKAVEQGLREIAQAPEQRAARRLAAEWEDRGGRPVDGKRVVIITPRSWASHVQQESVIAHALSLRGAAVTVLTCGGGLDICDRTNVHEGPPMPCRSCRSYTEASLSAHGVAHRPLFPDQPDQSWPELDAIPHDELIDVEYRGVPVGRLTDIPTQWFLLTTRDDEPLLAMTRRRFLRSARAIVDACEQRLDELVPDHVVLLNGGFLFESIMFDIARRRDIDVVSYERGFRHGTLFFIRNTPAIRYDIGESWTNHRGTALTPAEDARLDALLHDRRSGQTQFIAMSPEGEPAVRPLDTGTTFVLFTNLTWDSAVIHREIAFESVRHWMRACIEAIASRPQDQLVIRIHPAERKLPGKETREPFGALIEELFPELPGNITVLDTDDPTDSYALMDLADVGLVYTSTTGMEMALSGIPVVVAAQTHYRGRGFTVDVDDEASFHRTVERLGDDPTSSPVDLTVARRYANAFFFKRLLPAWFVTEPILGLARVEVRSLRELEPGADHVMDVLCEGILDGGSFEVE